MDIIGIVVRVKEGFQTAVLKTFQGMPHVHLYGVKDDRIVLTLDTDDIHMVTKYIKEIQGIVGVIEIYPVFSRDSFPF